MPSEDYVREKLYTASHCLAVGSGTLRQRLVAATIATLTLKSEDFVDEQSRTTFSGIRDTVTAHDARGAEGSVEATVARMSDEQVDKAARAIFDLDEHYRPLWYFVGRSILDPPPEPTA